MHRRRLTRLAVARDAQSQDADVRPLRSCAHNLPCLLTTDRPPSTAVGVLAREEKWLMVGESMFLCPEQQRARQVHLTSGQEDPLGQATGIPQVWQNETVTPSIHRSKSQCL